MNLIELEDVACPLGCPKHDQLVLLGKDLIHDLPGEFNIVKCRTCGLMRTNPRPTPAAIGAYYPDDYGPYLGTQVIDAATGAAFKKTVKRMVRGFFDFKTDALPAMPPGRMLEVGCASGAFLHRMAGQGWQVQGIEFSPVAAESARSLGYRVHTGPLETAPPPDEPFDLIVGWMVLEHLHDPVAGLNKLREWAKPGAWLALSIPNAASLEFQIFKNRWYALHLPNHLYHFTPQTVARVLAAGGWKLEAVHHQRVLGNLIASTGYVLRDKGCRRLGEMLIKFPEYAAWWSYGLYPLAWLLSGFGQTGRMTVWARLDSRPNVESAP